MKQLVIFLILGALVFTSQALASEALVDVHEHGACSYCGMDRGKFSHSRMLIEYDNDTKVGICSLHCAAIDLANNIDATPTTIQVGEYNTKQLIDAEQAVWVLGGKVSGVMTARAKWAFAGKEDAEQFVGENGGEIVDFETAIRAAYEDLYLDTKMIREKRKKKHMMKMKS